MRRTTVGIALFLTIAVSSAKLGADDHSVLFDPDVNFATFKTFSVQDGPIASQRPELNSPLAIKALTDAIRTALTAKGLKEVADAADLVVEYAVTSVDWGIGPFGRANPINTGRGRQGAPSTLQADYTDATLVIDLKAGRPRALVWRGVFNDTEQFAATLAGALPRDAAVLLSNYPPKRK